MTTSTYPSPVDRLLKIGDPREERGKRDYLALGLGPEHVPDLIRMTQEDGLHDADSESQEVWGPLHAWRALGQLRAEQAIEPLLSLLHRFDDEEDDWVGDDLPVVFGQIGPAAISPLEQYAASSQNPLHARGAAATGLQDIGLAHPEARDAVVAALTRLLENYAEPGRDPALNGFLVSSLVDLEATEAARLMERAFAAGAVEGDMGGDWEDVQIELGLKEERATERQRQSNPALETMQHLEQLSKQQSKPAAKKLAPGQPSGSKRKHHRRKK
jgi:hypothetical protein